MNIATAQPTSPRRPAAKDREDVFVSISMLLPRLDTIQQANPQPQLATAIRLLEEARDVVWSLPRRPKRAAMDDALHVVLGKQKVAEMLLKDAFFVEIDSD